MLKPSVQKLVFEKKVFFLNFKNGNLDWFMNTDTPKDSKDCRERLKFVSLNNLWF